MIGRLLQQAASSFIPHGSLKPPTQALESVTEETYTRELLFPEVGAPRQTQHQHHQQQSSHGHGGASTNRISYSARDSTSYDDRAGIHISYPNDVRIIVAQDVNARHEKPQVLYDSAPPPPLHPPVKSPPTSAGEGKQRDRNAANKGIPAQTSPRSPQKVSHSRQSSLLSRAQFYGSSPSSPRSPESPFRRYFGESTPSRPEALTSSSPDVETAQAKLAREAREDTDGLLGCMFGTPGFRLDPGVKLHIIPQKTLDTPAPPEPFLGHRRPGSAGGGFSRQRTPLIRSTSAADIKQHSMFNDQSQARASPSHSRPALMITRLFAVPLSDPVAVEETNGESALGTQSNLAALDPNVVSTGSPPAPSKPSKPKQVKQRKTPMYAIAFIIQLPSEPQRSRKPSTRPEPSSLGSSYEHAPHTPHGSWRGRHHSNPMSIESSHFGGPSSVNVHVAQILAHWALIGKALENLELVLKDELFQMLGQQSALLPKLIADPPIKTTNGKVRKPRQNIQQSVFVTPASLQNNILVQEASVLAGTRIVVGLKIPRVVTGQGRWGAWREEARWVGRWAGGKEQNFFLFSLLNAFLGVHTNWIETFWPAFHVYGQRRRQKFGLLRDRPYPRTIIVSSNKMGARRLIFLLASFFPDKHFHDGIDLRQHYHRRFHQPNIISQSPTSVLTVRDPPIRYGNEEGPAVSKRYGQARHSRSVSFSVEEANRRANEISAQDFTLPEEQRQPDTRSMRSASLAIPTSGINTRKTSMATVTADPTEPVAHFSIAPKRMSGENARPGSSESLASLALTHSLKRTESGHQSSMGGSGGRWGSMVSGFWSIRRESSTDESDAFGSSQEGTFRPNRSKDMSRPPSSSKLSRMIEEVSQFPIDGIQPPSEESDVFLEDVTRDALSTHKPSQKEESTKPKGLLGDFSANTEPLDLSINEHDGAIDIKLPPRRSFVSSVASSYNSTHHPHSHSHPNSTHSFPDHYSPYGRPILADSPRPPRDPPVSVAGWLKTFHPDFSLQALRPYGSMITEIKQAMCADLRLSLSKAVDTNADLSVAYEGWQEANSTLVADATTFSLRKITLMWQLVVLSDQANLDNDNDPWSAFRGGLPHAGQQQNSAQQNTSVKSNAEKCKTIAGLHYEERFVSDPLMDFDAHLTDAVERVLAQSQRSSRIHSRAPSLRATSPLRMTSIVNVKRSEASIAATSLGSLGKSRRADRQDDDGEEEGYDFEHEQDEPNSGEATSRELRNKVSVSTTSGISIKEDPSSPIVTTPGTSPKTTFPKKPDHLHHPYQQHDHRRGSTSSHHHGLSHRGSFAVDGFSAGASNHCGVFGGLGATEEMHSGESGSIIRDAMGEVLRSVVEEWRQVEGKRDRQGRMKEGGGVDEDDHDHDHEDDDEEDDRHKNNGDEEDEHGETGHCSGEDMPEQKKNKKKREDGRSGKSARKEKSREDRKMGMEMGGDERQDAGIGEGVLRDGIRRWLRVGC
ncbi:hypothetical protein MMC25_006797 [Agyrium rufum]|nr:hypothetical protein [Agyrium rufum]